MEFKLKDTVQFHIRFMGRNGLKQINWKDKHIVPSKDTSFEFNSSRNYKNLEEFDLTRLCEIELEKSIWSKLDQFTFKDQINDTIKLFSTHFELIEGFFAHNGNFLFKLQFRANKVGVCDVSDFAKVLIKINKEDGETRNEVRPKTLLFDQSSVLEIRQNDLLTVYLTKQIHFDETESIYN